MRIGCPFEAISAAPRAIVIAASVVTKDGSFRNAIRRPEQSPTVAPTSIVSPTAAPGIICCTHSAETTLPSAETEPTDRSIPRVRMTNSIPTAIRPVPETCRSTFMRFRSVRNTSDMLAAMASSTNRITAGPKFWIAA